MERIDLAVVERHARIISMSPLGELLLAMAAELRAARKARNQLSQFYDRLDFVQDAEALSAILLAWDGTP